jgi:glycosyltransferase involved in cell wall biosynthesis
VHRFGADIAGGSEGHCRLIAEHLAASHDVTVVTTTAHDHVTWANHYPPGEERLDRLTVRRFPVERTRDLHRFRDLSDLVFADRGSRADQEEWFRENGPCAPALLDFLRSHGSTFDLVLFWSYRYYHAYFGLPLVPRAVLVPTAEEDPLIHLDLLDEYFARPRGYLFLTPEEEALIGGRVPASVPRAIIGCGLDEPSVADRSKLDALGIRDPFVLYLGRIDPNKGCETLIRHFIQWTGSQNLVSPANPANPVNLVNPVNPVNLVLAGPANMPVPPHPQIRQLGFVDEATRDALLAHARVLMMPSPYESLSMVLLEAWNHRTPALVNARCAVLKGQILRADVGLYYQYAAEFAGALDHLLQHSDVARQLGAQGFDYVQREYRWPTV